ncbi:MAG: hypothetical protein HDS11_06040 [Bacteroides sp.]|nr:hypothetical protein [Bacteroides sp.]
MFGNFDFNGREIYPYGSSLKASDIVVLKPRIIYDWSGPSDLCKTKELYLKYYNSDGDLIKFAIDSQEEVTYVGTITFHTGTLNTAYFSKFDDSFIVPKPREAESSPLDEDEYITSITSLLINRNIHRQYNYHSGRIRVEIYCDNTLLWSGYVMLH